MCKFYYSLQFTQVNMTISFGVPKLIVQYLALVTSLLVTVSCGMNIGWPSITLPQLLDVNSSIPITNEEGSWIVLAPMLGGIVGNYVAALVVDIIGRKKVLLLTTIPSFIIWMVIAYVPDVSAIIAARFIAGVADGAGFCAIPLYLGEIADPQIRGFIGSCIITARILGALVINITGSYLDLTLTALAASLFPLFGFLTFLWMPESPYFFLMKENFEQARNSLKLFKGTDDVDQELDRLKQAVKEQQQNSGGFLDLFTVASNRRALLVPLVTLGTQQLSGASAITFYAKTILQSSEDAIPSSVTNIVFFSVQLIVCSCCSMIVDRTGRRPLLIFSVAGSALALFTEGMFFYLQNETNINTKEFNWIPVAVLLTYVIIFGMGMQTIPVLLLAEVFPVNVKAFASAMGSMYFCAVVAIVSKFFQYTMDEYGLHVPFFFFAGFCILGLILMVLFVPETKGRTLEDIQLALRAKSSRHKSFSQQS